MAEFSLKEIEASLSKLSIPILILDERYNIVMPERMKTPEIVRLEAELAELLKQQGKVTESIKDVKKLKSRLLQDVVSNMEEGDNEAEYTSKMGKSQKLLTETKEKLKELEDRELDLPREIRAANHKLLLELVSVCYGRMEQNQQDIVLLDRWINQMRVELKKKLLVKHDKEQQNSNIYSYMHGLLGPDLITMFDQNKSTDE